MLALARPGGKAHARRRQRRGTRAPTLGLVVSPVGFEPTTQGLKVPRSATELRAHVVATIPGRERVHGSANRNAHLRDSAPAYGVAQPS